MKRNTRSNESRAVQSHNGPETGESSSDDLYARVAALAYAFYERRGRQDGQDVDDWIRAEKTILEENASPHNGTAL